MSFFILGFGGGILQLPFGPIIHRSRAGDRPGLARLSRADLEQGKGETLSPTLLWAGLALLITIQGWWASFGMRLYTNWNFVAFLVIVLHAISIYMVAALVLPNIPADENDRSAGSLFRA